MPVLYTRFLTMRQLALLESAVVSAGLVALNEAVMAVVSSYLESVVRSPFTRRMDETRLEQALISFEHLALEEMDKAQRRAFDLVNEQFIASFGDVVNDHYDGDIPYRTTYEEWLETERGNDRLETVIHGYTSEIDEAIDARLRQSIEEGLSPEELVELVKQDVGASAMQARYNAFAQTEMMEAFRAGDRELSLELANELDGVHEWEWLSAHDSSVCIACLAMDGQRFHIDDYPDFQHVSCRCQVVLRLDERYEKVPARETGEEWLARQDEETQKKILGSRGRYASYKMGMPINEMVRFNHHPEWGTSIGPQPIKVRTISGTFDDIDGGSRGPTVPGIGIDRPFWGSIPDDWQEAPLFDTWQETQQWLQETYPHTRWSLDGVSDEMAAVVAQQHHRLARDFPEVASKIQVVSTFSDRPGHWDSEYGGYMAYAAYDPKRNKRGEIQLDNPRIGLNPNHFGDASRMDDEIMRAVNRGHFPPITNGSIASMYTHEFGHHVDFWLQTEHGHKVHEYVAKNGMGGVNGTHQAWTHQAYNDNTLPKPSAYGRVSEMESWAEGFSAIYHVEPDNWGDYARRQEEYLKWIGDTDNWQVKTRDADEDAHRSIDRLTSVLNWFEDDVWNRGD